MASREAHLMLKDAISGLPHIENITITDAQGIIVNSSRFWPIPPLSVAEREYYKALKANQYPTSVLSELILNRTTGTASIYLARKFFGPNGQMIGIVVGGMEQKYFERYFGTINLGTGSTISLLRLNGELIASHPARRSWRGAAAWRPAERLLRHSVARFRTAGSACGPGRFLGGRDRRPSVDRGGGRR